MLGEMCFRVGPFLEEFSQIKKHVFDIGGFFWVEISFRQDQFAFLDDEAGSGVGRSSAWNWPGFCRLCYFLVAGGYLVPGDVVVVRELAFGISESLFGLPRSRSFEGTERGRPPGPFAAFVGGEGYILNCGVHGCLFWECNFI